MKKLKEVCIFINHTANSGREIRLARKPGICYNRDMEKRVEYTVAVSDLPGRVEDILRKKIGLTPHQIRSARYRQEGICLNGVRVRTAEKVREGDRLQVLLEERETGSQDLETVCGPLEILYEDEDLAAVNKPAGTAVHPAHGHWKDTLANYLRYYYESRQLQVKIRAIGRLDLETSGIVVFAKNQAAAARLWQPGRVEKEYWALAEGHLEKERGRIELPLGKKEGALNQMEARADGLPAVTDYQVLERRDGADLVSLRLKTGRTHQIRVHMAALGHPLLGDGIYGGDTGKIGRAALHCRRARVIQPFTGRSLEIEAPLPEDMKKLLEKEGA